VSLLLTQMAVVLFVTLACGWVASRLGQSRVIGEIVGGILLGPSVLGHVSHTLSESLFPVASLKAMEELSTVGLVIYMFLVGMELDVTQMRRQKATAFAASATSIVIPFLAGAMLAHSVRARFAPHGIGSLPFVLFLGIAMSITAFPVLVRILEERELSNTPLGTLATICAAFDDVVAWTLLAITLTLVNPNSSASSLTVRFVVLAVYLLLMFGAIRPLSGWVANRRGVGRMSYEGLCLTFGGLLLSAAVTDWAGVHPLFGAFVAGVCFPRVQWWQEFIRNRTETITSALLLPLFFALTGLRTRLDLLTDPSMWLWAGIILVAAVGGKIGGAVLAARWSKQSWSTAMALGALLNTRGLVELIVLNIAYSVGAFSPTLFTMLVVMALLTTMCTNPILNILKVRGRTEATNLVDA
jgi:Kef-type K+ transport system membrane component KefB